MRTQKRREGHRGMRMKRRGGKEQKRGGGLIEGGSGSGEWRMENETKSKGNWITSWKEDIVCILWVFEQTMSIEAEIRPTPKKWDAICNKYTPELL